MQDQLTNEKESERRLASAELADIRQDSGGDITLGATDCTLDCALQRIAVDEMDDPPAILCQFDRAFDRSVRRGRFAIAGRLYQIEDNIEDPGIVDDRIRRAKRTDGERREIVPITGPRSYDPHRPVGKFGQPQLE
jgi:hypothetical protein